MHLTQDTNPFSSLDNDGCKVNRPEQACEQGCSKGDCSKEGLCVSGKGGKTVCAVYKETNLTDLETGLATSWPQLKAAHAKACKKECDPTEGGKCMKITFKDQKTMLMA